MMRPVEDFYRWVLPWATTCPEPTADRHIIDAARDFCRATRCWRYLDERQLAPDEREIVAVPNHAVLFQIEAVSFNGERLDPVAYLDADLCPGGPPRQYAQVGPMSIVLAPQGACGTLSMSVFLQPAIGAPLLPDFIREQYGKAIGDGALASILTIPDQAYSKPQLAEYHRGLFQQAKDENFAVAAKGQQHARVRSRARFF